MRRSYLLTFIFLVAIPVGAYADYAKPKVPQTRLEEIQQVQDRLDKLNKMTDEEWQERRKHDKDRRMVERNIRRKSPATAAATATPDATAATSDATTATPSATTATPNASTPPNFESEGFFSDPSAAKPAQPAQ
jgi:hypothetical protein